MGPHALQVAEGGWRTKFTFLLDRLAYPAGALIRESFERLGCGDVDALVEEMPKAFIEKIVELLDGDRSQAVILIYAVAKIPELEHGVQTDASELLKAFELNDSGYVKGWLAKLDNLLGGS